MRRSSQEGASIFPLARCCIRCTPGTGQQATIPPISGTVPACENENTAGGPVWLAFGAAWPVRIRAVLRFYLRSAPSSKWSTYWKNMSRQKACRAVWRALILRGTERVRIHLPPAGSLVRTRLPGRISRRRPSCPLPAPASGSAR